MNVYKNRHFTKRDYESTNVVACVADRAPDENYFRTDADVLNGLTKLWTEQGVTYYGYL